MRQQKQRLVVLLAVVLAMAAWGEDFDLPAPVPSPAKGVFVPEGEKQFMLWGDTTPGVRMWRQGMAGNMWHYGTTQSVGDGAGMYVYAPAGGPPGNMCAYDTGVCRIADKDGKVTRDDFNDYKGISMWVKGDGSAAAALISTGYGGSENKFRIPLKEESWHKVFLAWEKWDKPVKGPFWFINFGLERADDAKSNWYIVDRVHLYKEEKTEEIQPTPDQDPPGKLPARAFVFLRENISKTLEKLKNKQPAKIVCAGDSITVGAQLWYTNHDNNDKKSAISYTYQSVLGARLKEHYGYNSLALIHRSYDGQAKAWKDSEDPRPTGDLTVMCVATGGWKAASGLEHIEQIILEKPDLVAWEYGANDVTYGKLDAYVSATEAAIGKLKEAGIEVVLQTITPGSDLERKDWMEKMNPMEKGVLYNAETRRIAKEKGCALADMEKAFLARGAQFAGDLYSDQVHPNHLGHEMIGDVLDAMLTGRDVRIWKYGPAADKAKQAK